ncbi:MAG: Maf family protein, partial [Pseudomonadota bacterium]
PPRARSNLLVGFELAGKSKAYVIGSDTAVVCDDKIFGKPIDATEAKLMLNSLSGKAHQVMTAVALASQSKLSSRMSISEVTFRQLSNNDIDAYIATGESFGKAGAYAIQGQGAVFIRHLSGSYSGVMGLPLYETAELLTAEGINCLNPEKTYR